MLKIFFTILKNKTVNIAFIGTNNSQSGAIFHAKSYQIPYLIFQKEDLNNPDKVIKKLNQENIDLLVLAGFLLKLPSDLFGTLKVK